MAAVLGFPSHFSSSPPASLNRDPNGGSGLERRGGGEGEEEERGEDQLSLLALLLTVLRKSLVGCRPGREERLGSMEIGWPTEVQHVAHVTFDRFHGFLGLPSEFEPEVPRRAPSASATVFGVSTESMQCSFDSRGNSVPTILLQMQRSLYVHGGLQAEGIFRITAGNSQEEYVRDQLNRGIVPDNIDVHCLAGLIKAWFRELPTGVLDSLSPEQVMQCQSEDECVQLVKCLPPAEASLMDWAVNLMSDVVQEEQRNKMNSHNVAMVFAPNMTQMADPLTALMYAVRVMNFLKMLIERTLQEREESILEVASVSHSERFDENDDQGPHLRLEACSEDETEEAFIPKERNLGSLMRLFEETSTADVLSDSSRASGDDSSVSEGASSIDENSLNMTAENDCSAASASKPDNSLDASKKVGQMPFAWSKVGQSGHSNFQKGATRVQTVSPIPAMTSDQKSRSMAKANCMNSKVERLEAWR